MMGAWWLLWVAFTFLFLVPTISYGWGYRRWGPAYPSYIQRRRASLATAAGGSAAFNHRSWGWGGDFVWAVLTIAVLWGAAGLWW